MKSVTAYQAVVLGGNAHMSHWLDAAVRFARHHRKDFADRAVWLFSSGPEGLARSTAQDTPPQEFHQLLKLVEARGERVGDRPVPGAAEAVDWLVREGIPHCFLTNTTSRPRQAIVARLVGLGIPDGADQVVVGAPDPTFYRTAVEALQVPA